MNLKMKTERYFTNWVPEKLTDVTRHGYLNAKKELKYSDSDYVSVSKQMQSLLHSNVTCHFNAKHSLRKGKHFIWLFYGHLP